jgi:hypothetical protein
VLRTDIICMCKGMPGRDPDIVQLRASHIAHGCDVTERVE